MFLLSFADYVAVQMCSLRTTNPKVFFEFARRVFSSYLHGNEASVKDLKQSGAASIGNLALMLVSFKEFCDSSFGSQVDSASLAVEQSHYAKLRDALGELRNIK